MQGFCNRKYCITKSVGGRSASSGWSDKKDNEDDMAFRRCSFLYDSKPVKSAIIKGRKTVVCIKGIVICLRDEQLCLLKNSVNHQEY